MEQVFGIDAEAWDTDVQKGTTVPGECANAEGLRSPMGKTYTITLRGSTAERVERLRRLGGILGARLSASALLGGLVEYALDAAEAECGSNVPPALRVRS
jgi:hypothetical protein